VSWFAGVEARLEESAALPIADDSWITLDPSFTGLRPVADPSMRLVPNVRIEGDRTLVISIPGGYDARILLLKERRPG